MQRGEDGSRLDPAPDVELLEGWEVLGRLASGATALGLAHDTEEGEQVSGWAKQRCDRGTRVEKDDGDDKWGRGAARRGRALCGRAWPWLSRGVGCLVGERRADAGC